ncbi:DUF6348 family protein [Undibacterium pigrum]|uniref:Uncharacterized protein n=1 Tax=Undibacterium pigrum TaxID=401470 RepID=A0A318JAB1_9BURK|nr:DUF6348 family protein [Undibacterium pigrum]PXX43737.1 hypothetical protein DFR42_1035 [Undibacterium pigrum]
MSVTTSLGSAFKSFKAKFASSTALPVTMPVFANLNIDAGLTLALSEVLTAEAIKLTWQDNYLALEDGLMLAVERVETVTLAEDKFRTCTRIYAIHASYFPQGLSEYQHAMGATESEAVLEGLRTWVKMDLLVLQDAIREQPLNCTVIEMNTSAETAEEKSFRQVILGPVAHLASLPAPKKKEEHPFCPCCLFTESMPAFHDLLQTSDFIGIRLFASRDNEGKLAADCRVNGEDFLPAVEHLKLYAEKWPERGLEFRKQYVVIKTSKHSVNQAQP